MKNSDASLLVDIENIQKIPMVPTMLEVICRSTGMGFAAIARVTKDRWIACGVRDEILFGLAPGGELEIATTICNEIRDMGEAVIIDNVDESELYSKHHTPQIYGFQSYISVPIILKNGEFFGTLCAIDPKPAQLNNPQTIGMFTLFADLISFHLQSLNLIERSHVTVQELNRQLSYSADENRQYQYISNHNLQEPLRKIRIFSNMLVDSTIELDKSKTQEIARKINSSAQRFSMMVKDLSDFSELNQITVFEDVDLNKILSDVCLQLDSWLEAKQADVKISALPVIQAAPMQLEQLFYHLINNSIRFSRNDIPLSITVKSSEPDPKKTNYLVPAGHLVQFVEILLEDNGIGIEESQLDRIFDIFVKLPYDEVPDGSGVGLAYCRKIIRNHGGDITARSQPGKGTAFSIILPVKRS